MSETALPAGPPRRGDAPGPGDRPLPRWLDGLVDYGLGAVALGVALMAVAFVTNPVPDPSFEWATLPAALRVGYAQPRIEHWPVTYAVGLWLVVFAFPLVLLAAYRRYGPASRFGPSAWLTGLPVAAMLAFTTYCRFLWPKLHPATWNAPSYTLVCWAYCASYVPAWSDLAYAVGLAGVGALVLAVRDSPWATHATAAWGVLAFPLGLPALYDAYRRRGARA